jgi:hypothetical protein
MTMANQALAVVANADERSAFDPRPHVRQLRGRGGQAQDYLDVKWRLLWLRRRHPNSSIETELLRLDGETAVFKASIREIDDDHVVLGTATGHGSETAGDFGDFIEKAETKAIGRALNALGYGAEAMGDDDQEAGGPTNASVDVSAAAVPDPHDDFWEWANSHGITTREQVEELVGESVAGWKLGSVKRALKDAIDRRRDADDASGESVSEQFAAEPSATTDLDGDPVDTSTGDVLDTDIRPAEDEAPQPKTRLDMRTLHGDVNAKLKLLKPETLAAMRTFEPKLNAHAVVHDFAVERFGVESAGDMAPGDRDELHKELGKWPAEHLAARWIALRDRRRRADRALPA